MIDAAKKSWRRNYKWEISISERERDKKKEQIGPLNKLFKNPFPTLEVIWAKAIFSFFILAEIDRKISREENIFPSSIFKLFERRPKNSPKRSLENFPEQKNEERKEENALIKLFLSV